MIRLDARELAEISGFIKEKYGVNLGEKSTLIEGRLGCYIKSKGFESFGEYFEYAKTEPTGTEMANLVTRISTNHTFFMRENDHFEYLARNVLPWVESLPGGNDLRLWSAGCSTGEEPYGLSIYILEYLRKSGRLKSAFDSIILASDISERALSIAAKGIYLHENLLAIPPEWIDAYFTDLGDGSFRVAPELRANVAFKKINLLEPINSSKPYHTIFCRNVMIYFDTETRITLINRFYDAMAPGAWLFVGHSESLMNYSHNFDYIQPSVYRKPIESP